MVLPLRRWLALGLLLAVWLITLNWAQAAAPATPASTLLLSRVQPTLDVQGTVDVWVDDESGAGVQQAAAPGTRGLFKPHTMGTPIGLSGDNAAWFRLRLMRAPGETDHWILSVPIPFLDSVSLFQRDGNGAWTEQKAGDAVAHTEWSRQGLIPAFSLNLASNAPQEVYLRVRNYTRADIPLRISTEDAYTNQQSNESLALGWALGLLVTFVGLSLLRFGQHHAHPDLAAAAYTVLMAATVAQINGILNATLWQSLPVLANHASRVIAPIAVGGSLLYMRELYSLSVHYHRFDRFLGSMGLAAIVFSVGVLVFDPLSSNQMESIIFVLATGVSLTGAVLSWRAGSPIWLLLVLATVPQAVMVLWLAAENLDLVKPQWEIRYVSSFFLTLSVPLYAFALSKLTHDRKEREQRTLHLDTQDALTGLLTPAAFAIQLEDALHRVNDQREPVALVMVNLVNYDQILAHFGQSMGEQCELRAVVKLHRVLRDVDPAGRIRSGKFALLLEGIKTRNQLNERMVKLIASGLIPQAGLEPPVPLQFHAACVLLHERPLEAASALDTLLELLSTMSPGTRRPIRFVDAIDTLPVDHGTTGSFQSL
ncbi:MAG: diguanylate cyclase [Rhodoferax sp.]|nr:diguanylate cyclase [Rhodoferax sp.]